MMPRTHKVIYGLARVSLGLTLLCSQACFGTGVSVADAQKTAVLQHALLVGDLTFTPPAPVLQRFAWSNVSAEAVTIDAIDVPDAARVTFVAPECLSFPQIPAGVSCALQATAHTDATPGVYPVAVSYTVAGQSQQASFNVAVVAGQLRINDGAPVTIDAHTTAVPVTVTNEGFDLKTLNLNVQCPPSGLSTSSCTLDANTCSGGLLANASCTARLVTTAPAAGQLGAVTAGGANTGAASCSVAISVGSLTVKNLAVSSPGTQSIVLINEGSAPLFVTDVVIDAASQTGIVVAGAAQQFAGCQQFTNACSVPITIAADASLGDNVGVISVTYTDGVASHTATGVLTLDTTTQITVHPCAVLNTSVGQQVVAATNVGPWVWHAAGLRLGTPLSGVSLSSTCTSEVAVGADYTATLSTTQATVEGATSALVALGSNLVGNSNTPVAIGRSMLTTGSDGNSAGYISFSTDEGVTWQRQTPPAALATWQASLLSAARWLVVGGQSGTPIAVTSADRGATWLAATMPSGVTGSLYSLAAHGNTVAALGDDGAGHALMLRSDDGGLTWIVPSSNLASQAPGALHGVAYNGNAWVVVGTTGANTISATSTDDLITWTAAPNMPGALYGVAWDGRSWVSVGQAGSTDMLILSNSSAQAAPGNWVVRSSSAQGAGSLSGIVSNGTTWLAVGGNGSARVFVPSLDATVPTFAAPIPIGQGTYEGVASHNGGWLAAGFNSATSTPVVDVTTDGATATSMPQMAGATLTGVSSR